MTSYDNYTGLTKFCQSVKNYIDNKIVDIDTTTGTTYELLHGSEIQVTINGIQVNVFKGFSYENQPDEIKTAIKTALGLTEYPSELYITNIANYGPTDLWKKNMDNNPIAGEILYTTILVPNTTTEETQSNDEE